jgi:hypothetical protein
MSLSRLVEYADGLLLILMFGFLVIVSIALALEALCSWFGSAVLMRWRAWRGSDPDDKEHA